MHKSGIKNNGRVKIFVGVEKIIAKKWKFGIRKEEEGRYLLKFCESEPRKVKQSEKGKVESEWKGKEIEAFKERGSMSLWKRGGGEKKKGREGNQMHAQFNRFPVDPLNAALKASATNRSNL